MEYLDDAGGDAHIGLGADPRVRNRIEIVVSLDVIVEIYTRALPFGELPIGGRQRISKELGFFRYGAEELQGLLRRRGYGASRLSRNVGHNQSRLCFVAQASE